MINKPITTQKLTTRWMKKCGEQEIEIRKLKERILLLQEILDSFSPTDIVLKILEAHNMDEATKEKVIKAMEKNNAQAV